MFFRLLNPKTKTELQTELAYWHKLQPKTAKQAEAKRKHTSRIASRLEALTQAELDRFHMHGAI